MLHATVPRAKVVFEFRISNFEFAWNLRASHAQAISYSCMISRCSANPPAWIFGPVWTFLFILMGYALYLIWNKGLKKKGVADAVALFGIQLILILICSILLLQ